jgi:biopolymer transport protein ExbD
MRDSAKHINRSRTGWRTIAIRPASSAQSEINVTPLIDVVLVLLIIFMVATPLAEKDLAVLLANEKHTERASDVAPTQIAVELDALGGMRVNEQAVQRSRYVAELTRLLEGRPIDQRVVFVIANDQVRYPSLVETIDGAKRAGAATVGLALDSDSTP